MAVTQTLPTCGRLTVFKRSEDAQGPGWTAIPDLPFAIQHGRHTFIRLQPGDRHTVHATVNGYPIVGGFQRIEAGDTVRIVQGQDDAAIFRLRQAQGTRPEAGAGRLCDFTGLPIKGDALRCLACMRIFRPSVAEHIGICICGHSLKPDTPPAYPEEELL